MKILKQGLCLALLGAGLAAVPATLTAQAANPSTSAASSLARDPGLAQDIRDTARGQVALSTESATKRLGFARVARGGDLLPGVAGDTQAAAGAKADRYLAEFGKAFGAATGQLNREQVTRDGYGGWTTTYTQSYRGVPVFGAMLRAHVDAAGALTSVNGYAAPGLDLSVTPRVTAAEAGRSAVAAVKTDPPGHEGEKVDVAGLKAASTELAIYRTGVTRGDTGQAVLAYVVEVSNGANVRDMVFLDAQSGKLVNRYSLVHDALHRQVYETNTNTSNLVWEEGDPFPGSLNAEQQNLVSGTGESYWFFDNVFGRNSYDDLGASMRTVNNDPLISCPNANWNGVTTNYCNGVTSDDVVAHEWGHAYTEYTWDGIYQWQPGALNESYSDIWGETIDLINNRMTDSPQGVRTVDQCSQYTRGPISMEITAPITRTCTAAPAAWGPVFPPAPGVTDSVVVGTDAGPSTTDGCTTLTNPGAVAGNFVYVDRGTCTFQVKVDNADAAGATGIVVGDNVAGRAPISMSGTADIYGLMVTLEDGAAIKGAGTVTATIQASGTAPVDNSYRWLMGEDSTAFGGAIRDMWSPNCYGDPGKVSDAQYVCDTADGGGVHSNSGVPNHGYALLVDGGMYNGVTVSGIGLDKAAAIYYVAMTEFQTPTTDFTDHADALEASCELLIDEDVLQLTTTPNATPPVAGTITEADCDEVTDVIAAVQLRTEPVQCNFQPILDQTGAPSLCGAGTTTKTVWKEEFEDGLAGWEKDSEIVYSGGGSLPWQGDATAPGGRAGGVARGSGDDAGACVQGAGDFSSRDSIISPLVTLPATVTTPKLTFDHYIATEFEFDGGNVKVSVNGGAFTLIPTTAYLFNPPNATMASAATNTSPMAGQPGFTGTDGGEVFGSWGTSFIDLAAIGIKGGDQMRFRFDMGRDGCGGLDGWYIDNVTVTNCETALVASAMTAEAKPKKVQKNKSFNVVATVTAPGATPTGTVEVYKGSKLLGTGTLGAGGKVTIKITKKMAKKLKVGKNTLTAKYLGSATVAPSEDDFVVKVKRKRN